MSARLQKKNKKNKTSSSSSSGSSESTAKAAEASAQEVSRQYKALVETERAAVRRALNEERSRYCAFVAGIKPMLDEETSMVSEFQQLEEVGN